MWKPSERIKYVTRCDHWPSADEAQASRLYSPLETRRLSLQSRTWVPAMVPWRSNEAGEVTPDVIDWYRRFARGKPGAIVLEATGIRDIPSGPLLRISNDRYIPALKSLVDIVRKESGGKTKIFLQLIDFLPIRRRPDAQKYFQRFLRVTEVHRSALNMLDAAEDAVRERLTALTDDELEAVLTPRELEDLRFGSRQRVTDIDDPSIAELPETLPALFAQAAKRAELAGFDGLELHYAHAYTMASFLSTLNTRSDGYGGDKESRARLPLAVFEAVRAAVKDDFVVGCRMLSDEIVDGGSRVDDAVFFATEFAKAGMDFISLSRGGKFDDAKQPKVGWAAYPYTGRSGYECMPQYLSDQQGPYERNVEPSSRIRSAVRDEGHSTPFITAGGIFSFEQAERLLAEEKTDIVAFARQALADPDWFEKVRFGYGTEVMLCRYSNYCEGLDQKHKQVTCELWDRASLDSDDAVIASDGRRRLTAPLWMPPE